MVQGADIGAAQDLQQNRSDALSASLRQQSLSALTLNELVLGGPEQAAAPTITSKFTLLAPFSYNDNILSAPSNTEQAAHGNPELKFEWQDQFAKSWLLYFALDASDDRYVNHPDADGDRAYTMLRVTYGNPDDSLGYKVMTYYSPTLSFSPTFASLQSTSQDLGVSVTKAFAYGEGWNPDTELANARKSLVFSFAAGRRLSNTLSSEFVKFTAEFDYQIDLQWALQFQTLVQERIFDANMRMTRNDTLISPTLTLAFAPDLRSVESVGGNYDTFTGIGSPELDLQVSYADNLSNVAAKRFCQWNIGPVLRARWPLP